ncbi:MAG: ATP-binding cassette domain-containing protein, partial [Planctomycetota bacterium]
MFILKSTNLVKTYNGRTVVNEVSFDVAEGEIVGLLGRNGAGKTTSFRMTVGMISPDGGLCSSIYCILSFFPSNSTYPTTLYPPIHPSIFSRLT